MVSLQVALGRVIKRRRSGAQMSQEAFAAKAGVHRTYQNQLEAGTRNPSLSTIERVASALGTTAADLLMDAEKDRRRR